jgi:hypothetical protein
MGFNYNFNSNLPFQFLYLIFYFTLELLRFYSGSYLWIQDYGFKIYISFLYSIFYFSFLDSIQFWNSILVLGIIIIILIIIFIIIFCIWIESDLYNTFLVGLLSFFLDLHISFLVILFDYLSSIMFFYVRIVQLSYSVLILIHFILIHFIIIWVLFL